MFQLVMSTIHDDAINEKWDSDSSVPHIEDGLVAIQAFWAYCAELSKAYGITFVLGENTNETTVLAVWAPIDFLGGRTATIYVELQKVTPKDDVDRIVELMQTRAKFTHQIHPS